MRNSITNSREARPLGLHTNVHASGSASSLITLVAPDMPAASARHVTPLREEVDRIIGLVGAVKALWNTAPSDPQTGLIFCDALEFAGSLPPGIALPRVWFDECEVVFEWIERGRHAVVSCEGDGFVGYTYRVEGVFVPGAVTNATPHMFPADLIAYLTMV